MQECINRVVALEQMGKALSLHISLLASYFSGLGLQSSFVDVLETFIGSVLIVLSACFQVEFLELWMIEGNSFTSRQRR